MKIAMIGAGYVGLVSGAGFSEFGFDVTCTDSDGGRIAALNDGVMPVYEPGLTPLVGRNRAAGRLRFTTDLAGAVGGADAVFIAVGTPARRGDGHADVGYVHAAAEEVARHLKGYTVVVTKSTVPVGTGREVEAIIRRANPEARVDCAANPEFLREGSAISDFMRPDRVVVGAESEAARAVMAELYRPLYLLETPILFTTPEAAEMIKYASNAFLAMKISYINQMADLCEAVGADVHDVARGMGLDKRIGAKFLHPGPGYGGSCFPKDTLALVKIAEDYGVAASLVDEVVRYNAVRKAAMAGRIMAAAGGAVKDEAGLVKGAADSVKGKVIACLGLAFKPETDDMRESLALDIIPPLVAAGARVRAYDPAAMAAAQPLLAKLLSDKSVLSGEVSSGEVSSGEVEYCPSAMACLKGADVAVVITEWNEFRALTPAAIRAAMRGDAAEGGDEPLVRPVLVDLRNIYDPAAAVAAGLNYSGIGRPVEIE